MNRRMDSVQRGFNLIELMIVVAVIGLLAAVAVPAYRDYSIRSKVSEALGMASSLKTSVVEQSTNGGLENLPGDIAGTSEQASRYVQELTVGERGVISVTTQNTGATVDPELRLVPSESGGGIVWSCLKTPDTLASQVPPNCRDDVAVGYKTSTKAEDIKDTVAALFRAFEDFTKKWLAGGGKMPVLHRDSGSYSWNNSTDFMNAFFEFAGIKDFNRSGYQPISDFKVFYKRDANGKPTSEVAGVYLQIGGTRHIRFSNGTTVSGKHYGDFIDNDSKQLRLP
ncbi:Pilin (modular protein) [Thiocapsa sp. KS1]|nr:Pilin (modular protein) [Thiocapsa sp. KS1]